MPPIKRQHIKLKSNSICPCDENMALDKPKKYKHCCLPKMVLQEQRAIQMINDNKESVKHTVQQNKGIKRRECKHNFQPRYNREWSTDVRDVANTTSRWRNLNGRAYLQKETYLHDICIKCGKKK